jgi:hypothetical protein
MTARSKTCSRILDTDTVHETARDLHTAGFIDKRRIREYDALCHTPVPTEGLNGLCDINPPHHCGDHRS